MLPRWSGFRCIWNSLKSKCAVCVVCVVLGILNQICILLYLSNRRATGELMTPATWMRRFVDQHPEYQHDSVITPQIAHDLLTTCHGIGTGEIACPEILGDIVIDRVRKEDAYGSFLHGHLNSQERAALIATLVKRANQPRSANVARGKARLATTPAKSL